MTNEKDVTILKIVNACKVFHDEGSTSTRLPFNNVNVFAERILADDPKNERRFLVRECFPRPVCIHGKQVEQIRFGLIECLRLILAETLSRHVAKHRKHQADADQHSRMEASEQHALENDSQVSHCGWAR